ncbi:MAG: hypothetical protein ABIP51_20710 [Bacteroidia bacterium]
MVKKINYICFIRKSFSIFLLSVYLISSTELNQFMKLPLFVKHFIEHKDKDAQLTLSEFIEIHYAHGDVKDADYDEDMKLPFKTHDACSGLSSVSFIPNNFENLSLKPLHSEENSYSHYQEKFLTSSWLSSIWQPPKSC